MNQYNITLTFSMIVVCLVIVLSFQNCSQQGTSFDGLDKADHIITTGFGFYARSVQTSNNGLEMEVYALSDQNSVEAKTVMWIESPRNIDGVNYSMINGTTPFNAFINPPPNNAKAVKFSQCKVTNIHGTYFTLDTPDCGANEWSRSNGGIAGENYGTQYFLTDKKTSGTVKYNQPLYVHYLKSKPWSFVIATAVSIQNYDVINNKDGATPKIFGYASKIASRKITSGTSFSQWFNAQEDKTNVVIPSGVKLILDSDINVGELTINGELRCADKDLTIQAQSIYVSGRNSVFECGDESRKYNNKLKIIMTANDVISVSDKATLRLQAVSPATKYAALKTTVQAGATQIQVAGNLSDWNVDDQIVLTPTGFDFKEAEDVSIEEVNFNQNLNDPVTTLKLKTKLQFKHLGQNDNEKYLGKIILSENALVGNLTRKIQIYPKSPVNNIGAHMMVMRTAKAYIDGVEFSRMGQMGIKASYPFHWHRVGDGTGQYLKNSSIHHTYQRCVTVHGTSNVEVSSNICYDHYGHGFFLEDGNETGNKILDNLGILSRIPYPSSLTHGSIYGLDQVTTLFKDDVQKYILSSDTDRSQPQRFAGPATYWISNPNNYVIGNIAAGSEGTGFWMGFDLNIYCPKTENDSCHVCVKDFIPDFDGTQVMLDGILNKNTVVNKSLLDLTSISAKLDCDDPSKYEHIQPNKQPTPKSFRNSAFNAFHDNKASTTMVGITWDGGPNHAFSDPNVDPNYNNDKTIPINQAPYPFRNATNPDNRLLASTHYDTNTSPVFGNLVVYNSATGIYFRGEKATFKNLVLANNIVSVFFAYDQILKDSLIIGRTTKYASNFNSLIGAIYLKNYAPTTPAGVYIYDGPLTLDNVNFENFSESQETYGNIDITRVPIGLIGAANRWTNLTRNLHFNLNKPQPFRKVDFIDRNNAWMDTPYSPSILDLDGTLYGKSGALVVADNKFNRVEDGSCTSVQNDGTAYCTGLKIGLFIISEFMPFVVKRSDDITTKTQLEPGFLLNKFNAIQDKNIEYTLVIPKTSEYCLSGTPCATVNGKKSWTRPDDFTVFFKTASGQNSVSPVVILSDLGSCSVDNDFEKAVTKSDFDKKNGSVYFNDGNNLRIKIGTSDTFSSSSLNRWLQGGAHISCLASRSRAATNRFVIPARPVDVETITSKKPPIVQLYRYYNGKDHMISELNQSVIIPTRYLGVKNYIREGAAYKIFSANNSSLAPLYRCYYKYNGVGFHSLSREKNCEGVPGVIVESIIGYIYPTQKSGTVPLYRLVNTATGDRLETLTDGEGGYAKEKILGYVMP